MIGDMTKVPKSDLFDEKEAKARFEAALRGARITGHKMMADIPKRAAKKTKPKKSPANKPS
jgi:hypothetical protein